MNINNDSRTDAGRSGDSASDSMRGFSQRRNETAGGLFIRIMIFVVLGSVSIYFGLTHEPELIESQIRLWKYVNLYPGLAVGFGCVLLILAVRMFFAYRKNKH